MKHSSRRQQRPFSARFEAWLTHHRESALATLGQLVVAPFATAMTVAAMAVALMLPASLYVLTGNLKVLGGYWDSSAAISVFLEPGVDEAAARSLALQWQARSDIVRAAVITREQGLAEFREYSGLGVALDQLTENPLPVVISVFPAPRLTGKKPLEQLIAGLEQLNDVDFIRLDTEWARRLQALVELLERALWLLSLALALGVLLVVGNTIRLEIENRRDEIEVMHLVGATTGFIRRPFLYSGAWYGLLSGLAAWVMVWLMVLAMQVPADRLAESYQSVFRLRALDSLASLVLIGGGTALGILGSWVAVGRHLGAMQPSR
ncbi:Cell division protein FtsX [Thiorhodovibrio winogradskyi]|uniref:Cell division protein FtsX n=1 Tax=Thiorhodovibrio winogradskyi TaxID=77007 RepID=A0ABZ0SG36_9GAMM|nr:permease-like cell division protein FtsX [Thiorhodovibrio winogradskyi]